MPAGLQAAGESYRPLEDYGSYAMPVLSLKGVVCYPGEALPLLLNNEVYRRIVRRSMEGNGGTRGLLFVSSSSPSLQWPGIYTIGTVAQITRISGTDPNERVVTLYGRQRASIKSREEYTGYVRACILSDVEYQIPREVLTLGTYWPFMMYRQCDPEMWKQALLQIISDKFIGLRLDGSPSEVSFKAISMLPFDAIHQQQLLEAENGRLLLLLFF